MTTQLAREIFCDWLGLYVVTPNPTQAFLSLAPGENREEVPCEQPIVSAVCGPSS
jgi:hypothetical protein